MYGRKKKYLKLVRDRVTLDRHIITTVHAYIDPVNGDVYKPTSGAPAKNPIHCLLDEDSREWLYKNCTSYGSELYKSNTRRDWKML